MFKIITLIFIVIVEVITTSQMSLAAQQVVLKIGIMRGQIPVEDLQNLVEKEQVSPKLAFYLRKTNQKPEKWREILREEILVNPITLADVLNHPWGELALDLLSEVIMTPSGRASRESLRGALITSALDDDKISLLELFKNYPTPEVHVDGDRLIKVYNKFKRVINLAQELRI